MEDSSSNPYIPQESEQIRQKVYERQSPLGKVVKRLLIATGIVAVLVGIGLIFVIPRTSAVDKEGRIKLADALQVPADTLKRVSVASTMGFKLSYDGNVYSSYAEVGDSTAGTDASAAIMSGQTYENTDLRTSRAYNYVRIYPIQSVSSARALATQPPQLEIFSTVTDKDLVAASTNAENKGLSKLSLFVKLDGDKRQQKKVADDNTVVTIDVSKPVSTTIGGIDYQKVRYTTTNDNYRVSNVKYDDCYYTIQNNQPYSVCITGVRPTNVSAASLVEQVVTSLTFEAPTATSATGTQTSDKKTSYVLPTIRLAQATTTTDATSSAKTTNSTNPNSAAGGSSSGGTSNGSSAGAADSADAAADTESDSSSMSPLITVTPEYYGDGDSLAAIAKTQPSVVRIGTLYCTDLALKYESGDTAMTLTDACAGSLATGVIVSKDGYIATTGHAIRAQKKAAINGYINFAPDQGQMLDRLQRILDYLLKAKIILQSDADYLKTGASTGDQEALAKIENIASVIPDNFITPINEQYSYAIQPSDKPIVINRTDSNKPSFAYSDSVISAKYVDSDYDAAKSVQETFDSATPPKDIGLLKIDGSYQNANIASSEDVKANDILSTVGYAAYADSSLTVDKIRNAPVVTSSKVDQAYKKDNGRLIQTDTPVLPGNDGAPVVNATGKVIGFAVYGLGYCPDQQCFANGTVRSISELQPLLDKNNIKLAVDSPASEAWQNGVIEYMKANYSGSAGAFESAGSRYPFNRWADPLNKLAVSLKGSSSDTSLMNTLRTVMVAVLFILVIATIVLAIAFAIHRRRLSQQLVGHYGAVEQPVVATPSIASPVLPPVSIPIQTTAPTQPVPTAPVAGQPQPVQQIPVTFGDTPVQQVTPTAPVQPPAQPAPQQPEDPFYK